MALDLSDANRIHPGLSAWIVNDFAQEILGVDPSAFLNKMVNDYEKRGAGKPIVRDVVQWIEGTNEALHYRGRKLLRDKIWLQRGDPVTEGVRRYGYTGWQWNVAPATSDVRNVPEALQVADRYDNWAAEQGYSEANHYIITRYKHGKHRVS